MALQGTIDAFPLTDVLQLLASSSKSGRLLLDGDRGRRTLWIDRGTVTGADGAASTSAAVAVMELLRFSDGSFEFHAATDVEPEPPVELDPLPLGSCLEQAAELLEEWERIEAVVPSMDHRVRLSDELVEDTVTLDRDAWALVASIVDRPTVATVVRRQELDEFAGCAALASLVARSLVVIDEPEPYLPELVVDLGPSTSSHDDRPLAGDQADATDPADIGRPSDEVAERLDFPDRFPIDDLLGGTSGEDEDPWSSIDHDAEDARPFAAAQTFDPIEFDSLGGHDRSVPDATAEAWDDVVAASTGALDADPTDPSLGGPAVPGPRPTDDAVDESTDEVLRQMSRLSPKAAEAIAAALSAPGTTESAPAHDATATRRDDDGPVTYLGSL